MTIGVRSSSAAQISLLSPRPMIGGSPFNTLLISKNRPFLSGSMMATWRKFLMILRYLLIDTRFFFRILWSSETMSLDLVFGILKFLSFQLTRKTNIYFSEIQCKSYLCNSFMDIGLFPPVLPVTTRGGVIL